MYLQPAPFRLRSEIGLRGNYFIHYGYQSRLDNQAFDDRYLEDEFQKEVYQYARQVAGDNPLVLDVGCGSGFKLVTNFFDCETVGLELPETVEFLQRKWPGTRHKWTTVDLETDAYTWPTLVICSDVIEHIPDPSVLLDFLSRSKGAKLIISTPERDELCNGTHDGPPKNIHHVREWNFAEFHAYLGSRFYIREHFVIQGTQILECDL